MDAGTTRGGAKDAEAEAGPMPDEFDPVVVRRVTLGILVVLGTASLVVLGVCLGTGIQGRETGATLGFGGATVFFGVFLFERQKPVPPPGAAPRSPQVAARVAPAPARVGARPPQAVGPVRTCGHQPRGAAGEDGDGLGTTLVTATVLAATSGLLASMIGADHDQASILAALLGLAVPTRGSALRPVLTEGSTDRDVALSGAWLVALLIAVLGALSANIPGLLAAAPLGVVAFLVSGRRAAASA